MVIKRVSDVNWESLVVGINKSEGGKIKGKEETYFSGYLDIFERILPMLGGIPVVSNKPSECLAAIRKQGYVETPSKDDVMSVDRFKDMLQYFYLVPRGNFLGSGKTALSCPKYGVATPLVMYALKLHQGIPYEYWDKEDKAIHLWLTNEWLSKILLPIMDGEKEKNKRPKLTREEIKIVRDYFIEWGGVHVYQTSTKYPGLKGWREKCGIPNLVGSDTVYMHMLMQTWIFAVDVRDEEVMILDPENWDRIPEPFDSINRDLAEIDKVSKPKKRREMPDLEF